MRKKRKRQKDAARLRLRRAGVMGERGGAPFLRGSFRASSRPCPAPSAGNAPRPQSAAVPPRARRKKRRARGGFAAGTPFPALRHSMAGRHAAGRRSACSAPRRPAAGGAAGRAALVSAENRRAETGIFCCFLFLLDECRRMLYNDRKRETLRERIWIRLRAMNL